MTPMSDDASTAPASPPTAPARRPRLPLAARVLIGVGIGVALGIAFGTKGTGTLGDLGMLVIRMLKTLAAPLILVAILDALLRTNIPGKKGAQLLGISIVNAAVATFVGLGLAHALNSGEGAFEGASALVHEHAAADPAAASAPPTASAPVPKAAMAAPDGGHAEEVVKKAREHTLDPLQNVMGYVPKNLVDPFQKNAVVSIVLLALLFGVALRAVRARGTEQARRGVQLIEDFVHAALAMFSQLLAWLVQLVPFAVLGVAAAVVGKAGWQVLLGLLPFLGTMVLGLAIQAVVYYSFLLAVVARRSPLKFFAGAADAIVTALSAGSSLATLPITLRCLNDNLKIPPASARLAACVGTNLNHDGIILYEACATLFVAKAFGYDLTVGQQVAVAISSVLAGVGIGGIPEAGLITLPLVLTAAGLPAPVVGIVIPLILPVDWIIGRCRAATNVIGDMTVAVLLDRFDR